MEFKINIKKLNPNAKTPTYGSEFSAGADLYACEGGEVTLKAGETRLIHTGIAIEIPCGYVGLIYARSGLASKHGITLANGIGVVDSDYRGEIMVSLHNHSDSPAKVEGGERVAQLAIVPFLKAEFEEADELSETVRGEGGFGSTGAK